MEKKTFTVNGMKCVHCKANVENAIKGVAGVASAEASLENNCVTVEYDATIANPEQFKEAVEEVGRFELETE